LDETSPKPVMTGLYFFNADHTKNVTILNAQLDYEKPTFAQGIILPGSINPTAGTFDIEMDDATTAAKTYPYDKLLIPLGSTEPPSATDASKIENNWANAAIYKPSAVAGKFEFVNDQIFIDNLALIPPGISPATKLRYRVYVANDKNNKEYLTPELQPGRLIGFRRYGETASVPMVSAIYSSNIKYINVSIYNTIKFAFFGKYNEGDIIHINCKIMPRPNTKRNVSGTAGGFIYSSGNRGRIIIDGAYVSANFDDAVNLGSINGLAVTGYPNTQTALYTFDPAIATFENNKPIRHSAPYKVGDVLAYVNLGTQETSKPILAGFSRITSQSVIPLTDAPDRLRFINVSQVGSQSIPNATVYMGNIYDGAKLIEWGTAANPNPVEATRLMNLNTSNPRSVIVNSTFENKMRNAILVRGYNIAVVGNTFRNLNGSAIDGLEGYKGDEGAWSYLSDYSGNYMENIGLKGVILGFSLDKEFNRNSTGYLARPPAPAFTYVTNNYMKHVNTGIQYNNLTDVYAGNNTYIDVSDNSQVIGKAVYGTSPSLNPLSHKPLFRVSKNGLSKLYYVTNRSFCVLNSTLLSSNWGTNNANFITDVPDKIIAEIQKLNPNALYVDSLPAGRTNQGQCLTGEAIYQDGTGAVYRSQRVTIDGVTTNENCKYANDIDFQISTGLTVANKTQLMNFGAPSGTVSTCKL
jgi:hypothetical protein